PASPSGAIAGALPWSFAGDRVGVYEWRAGPNEDLHSLPPTWGRIGGGVEKRGAERGAALPPPYVGEDRRGGRKARSRTWSSPSSPLRGGGKGGGAMDERGAGSR